jgi:hypothetical protein
MTFVLFLIQWLKSCSYRPPFTPNSSPVGHYKGFRFDPAKGLALDATHGISSGRYPWDGYSGILIDETQGAVGHNINSGTIYSYDPLKAAE